MAPTSRPFRFGVHLWALAEDWQAQVRSIEDRGFSTITFTDHLVVPQLEPVAAGAAVGVATSGLSVGSLVLDMGLRHPVVVAKEAATVHQLTRGRFELGLGAGYVAGNFRAVGAPFAPGSDRLGRLDEALSIIRSCWTEETTTWHGRHFDLEDAPRSLAEPVDMPILVGGGGPKAMALAGRRADIVSMIARQRTGTWSVEASVADSTEDQMVAKAGWARAAAVGAGRDLDELEFNTMVVAVAVTDGTASARASVATEQGVAPEATVDSSMFLVGSPQELRERLLERRDRCGLTYYSLFDPGAAQLDRIAEELIEPLRSC